MSFRREIYEMFVINDRTITIENYNSSSRYYEQIDKFIPNIKNKLKEIISKEKEENPETFLSFDPIIIRIILEIVFQPYSPYTYLNDDFIIEKIESITIETILNKILQWYSRFKLCNCNIFGLCYNDLSNLEINILKMIIKTYFIEHYIILKCNDIKNAYLYYIQENRVATPDELIQFENMMYEIENDPDEFHQKYKHKTPTKNISKLDFQVMNEELFKDKQPVCGLCQDEIITSQEYYKLPCEHMFHKNEIDCLDSANIIYWLKENNFCPMCKNEINL